MMNTHSPALVANAYRDSRIVAFAASSIYPLTDVLQQERAGDDTARAARRICHVLQQPRAHVRAFLSAFTARPAEAVPPELRHRSALWRALRSRQPHQGRHPDRSVADGHVSVIWQGRRQCAGALRCLAHSTEIHQPINVSGPETLSVRWLVHELAESALTSSACSVRATTAWLTNTAQANRFGYPSVPLTAMLDWTTADWVAAAGTSQAHQVQSPGRSVLNYDRKSHSSGPAGLRWTFCAEGTVIPATLWRQMPIASSMSAGSGR